MGIPSQEDKSRVLVGAMVWLGYCQHQGLDPSSLGLSPIPPGSYPEVAPQAQEGTRSEGESGTTNPDYFPGTNILIHKGNV